MTFRNEIKEGLKKLNQEQQVDFARRCALLALPILGAKGHFNFWKQEEQQKHLYAVFNAIDQVSAFSMDAAAARIDLKQFIRALLASYPATGLLSMLRDKLITPKASSPNVSININQLYGPIWDNFLTALQEAGCGYWATIYQQVFDNHLEIDTITLKKRLAVPEVIKAKGAAAVGEYLEELEKGAKRLNEARIIILGDKGAGKTCIARRLIDPKADMTTPEESTAGVDTTLWQLDDINVRIWDFAGHTVTHAVHQFFLSERCLYILVHNGRNEQPERLKYWLDQMKNYGGDSEAMIVVNERDQHSVSVPVNRLQEQYQIVHYTSFNVKKDGDGLEAFREKVAHYMTDNPSWKVQEIPASYYQVKEELEKRFTKKAKAGNQEHITKAAFDKIARKCKVDKPDELLKGLHALGVSLWYDQMEKYDTLVLNPEWISHGVYKIINWVNEAEQYSLTLDCFKKVFADEQKRYPTAKYRFLFDLIMHYELAFKSDEEELIIPHLLDEDQPAQLPRFDLAKDLKIKYEADQPLPSNTISRFIVRHNEQIIKENGELLVWKYGVILSDGNGSIALVREIGQAIHVSVQGISQTAYISELRDTLNALFASYKTKQPKLNYSIIGDELPIGKELFLPEQQIVTLNKRNLPFYDYQTDRNIPMQPVIVNYNINHYHGVIHHLDINSGHVDNSVTNHFNFQDCNFLLQGDLNSLARKLTKKGYEDEAEEIQEAVELLEAAEAENDPQKIKKKGLLNDLKRIIEDLGDEDSKLSKALEGVKRGKEIAQDIGSKYNSIAEWVGLPQVPKFFLKG